MLSFHVNERAEAPNRGGYRTMKPGSGATVYLGLGSNLGDRRGALSRAVDRLEGAGVRVLARSGLYRTEPVEVVDQEEFMNQVVACETTSSPHALLALGLRIEQEMGRVRTRDKGPRAIDLDLLLYSDLVLQDEGLSLPHPRLHLRRFVLVPLAEIAPRVIHPVFGLTIADLLARCPDQGIVEPDRPA
jgi:2-amino-4-hydroxy-6-hydroxymethyldihydropteridine diphosphokinase